MCLGEKGLCLKGLGSFSRSSSKPFLTDRGPRECIPLRMGDFVLLRVLLSSLSQGVEGFYVESGGDSPLCLPYGSKYIIIIYSPKY